MTDSTIVCTSLASNNLALISTFSQALMRLLIEYSAALVADEAHAI